MNKNFKIAKVVCGWVKVKLVCGLPSAWTTQVVDYLFSRGQCKNQNNCLSFLGANIITNWTKIVHVCGQSQKVMKSSNKDVHDFSNLKSKKQVNGVICHACNFNCLCRTATQKLITLEQNICLFGEKIFSWRTFRNGIKQVGLRVVGILWYKCKRFRVKV